MERFQCVAQTAKGIQRTHKLPPSREPSFSAHVCPQQWALLAQHKSHLEINQYTHLLLWPHYSYQKQTNQSTGDRNRRFSKISRDKRPAESDIQYLTVYQFQSDTAARILSMRIITEASFTHEYWMFFVNICRELYLVNFPSPEKGDDVKSGCFAVFTAQWTADEALLGMLCWYQYHKWIHVSTSRLYTGLQKKEKNNEEETSQLTKNLCKNTVVLFWTIQTI